jgi:hypothetical protein
VAQKRVEKNACRILVGNLKGKRQLERLRPTWKIILKPVLEKQNRVIWIGLIWLRIETTGRIMLTRE